MVGRAKNESFELIFGNLLIGIGGLLSGLAVTDVVLNFLFIWAIPIFGAGIILDVRVLRKFSFDINKVRENIENLVKDIDQNVEEIQNTKYVIDKTHEKISQTDKEITETQQHLNFTMNNLETAKKELEKLEGDIYPRNTVTNPNLLIRRFENIENFTMFDIDKEPILFLYKQLILQNPQPDFKSTQDFKLVKLLSLIYKLMWYNNSLLSYNGSKIYFEPLITLMNKKNRLNQLCKLKIHEYSGEINLELEQKMDYLVGMCYNSMIDSQDPSTFGIGDPDMMVKEHFVKVSEVNDKFKELFSEINDFLTVKFPDDNGESISNLKFSI